jgi:hypothetical protein
VCQPPTTGSLTPTGYDWQFVNSISPLIVSLLSKPEMNLLLVEGPRDASKPSIDQQLYGPIFCEHFTVRSAGSCAVVRTTVAELRATSWATKKDVYGLVDRDDHSPRFIQDLEREHVYHLEVSEAENLLWTPELLEAAFDALHLTPQCSASGFHDRLFQELDGRNPALYKSVVDGIVKHWLGYLSGADRHFKEYFGSGGMDVDGPLPALDSASSTTQVRLNQLLQTIQGGNMGPEKMKTEVETTLQQILALPATQDNYVLRAMAEALVADIVTCRDVDRALVHFSEKELIPKLINNYCKNGKRFPFSFKDAVARLVETKHEGVTNAILSYVPPYLRKFGTARRSSWAAFFCLTV